MKLHFLGANRQVTGSRYAIETEDVRVLIDCGMFQERAFQSRNWDDCPVCAKGLDAVLLTHAHLDHCGLLPRLTLEGYDSPIYATKPTVELAEIVMRDAAKIQMEDAAYKKKRHLKEKRKSAHPEVPLYTTEDVEHTLPLFEGVMYNEPAKINDHLSVTWHDAGHILGSAMLDVLVKENGRSTRIVFSGDVGQPHRPFLDDPSVMEEADYIIMESTYGDRDHPDFANIEDQLEKIIAQTIVTQRGHLLIPTFALERAQDLIYHIGNLVRANRIPKVMVFLDSPMAVDVTDVFRRYRDWFDEPMRKMIEGGTPPLKFDGLTMTKTAEESKKLNSLKEPAIILASSGMCTGGRIKHHLAQHIGDPKCTILFVGYQSVGTLGRIIRDGAKEVRIHGRTLPVHAQIASLEGFSAHGDRGDLLNWLSHFKKPPKQLFLTHGEEQVSLHFAQEIRQRMNWPVTVPNYRQTVELGESGTVEI
ncbi:MAG: MBL fold metallo-hydrolase [Planctomycetes bacterium]|nr:MBL fold metallo-hydrolase [Planctomycetota bacterium]